MYPMRIIKKLLVVFQAPSLVLLALSWQSPAVAQTLEVILTDTNGESVGDAVIELLLPEELGDQYQEASEHVIDQVDKEFVPHITTVVAGSEIAFPNSDAILHHVYSFSSPRTFNIPLYGRGENRDYRETFPNPGVVEIGCNIHDWMLAYVYVGASQLMAITTADGSAVLDGLPVGDFRLQVWHARLDESANVMLRDVSVVAGQRTTIELQVSLQRDRRIRRAPSVNRNRYR